MNAYGSGFRVDEVRVFEVRGASNRCRRSLRVDLLQNGGKPTAERPG